MPNRKILITACRGIRGRRVTFVQGILQAKKKGAEKEITRDARQPGSHTFHMPHRSPLVRNNAYICATKPFKRDKAVCVRHSAVPARPGAAPGAAARGYCWRGLKHNLARPLCVAWARRQRWQRCSSHSGAKAAADTRACCSNRCGQKN